MSNVTGGCLCGGVRYTLKDEPARRGVCHCRDCQRFTGSAFMPLMFFPKASVDLKGELKSFTTEGSSGHKVHRHFCSNCGSSVAIEAEHGAGRMLVAVGTLDDPSGFVPDVEIFCDFAQPWVNERADRKRFPRARV
jgi:hypothetical protein